MAANFCFATSRSDVTKILKTTFPKDYFNEIWLKVGEHEYIL